ncbi:UNVERIFIED_CONTAM: SDR family oxidoreductase [Microbacterium sp. SLM126]
MSSTPGTTAGGVLSGRVAIVSGAAGLYGRHISSALANAGAHVVCAARGTTALDGLVADLIDRGGSAESLALDLASEESIENAVATVVGNHGRIDILVNNAVARSGSDPDHTTAEDWDATSIVNSRGLFLMTRAVGRPMREARRGSIVNIGSIYGVVGPDFGVYRGTDMTSPASYAFDKAGMVGLTRYAAAYYGPYGIRVNCISPGGLETEDHDPVFLDNYRARVPLRRLADDDDIKGPVVFLASDASQYVTGVNLPVDGGWTAI